MGVNLPFPYVGGAFADKLPEDDLPGLVKQLTERFDALQGNLERLSAKAVSGPQDLVNSTNFPSRVVRGAVSGTGTVLRGTGFTAARTAGQPTGVYTVTYTKAFDSTPATVALPAHTASMTVRITSEGTTGFLVACERSTTGALTDPSTGFSFIVSSV